MISRYSACLGVMVVAGLVATPVTAQRIVPTLYPVAGAFADSGSAPADVATVPAQTALSCPDCNPPKRFGWGFAELMLVQAIPATFNNVKRGEVWAKISPRTWYDNLQNAWKWDDNAFVNNQFSHPYHGNLYFNAARTNGYSFWASAPWAFGGSLMWELFGEAWAPAPNDLWNTSLGGIALGEMLYRASSLTLDNTATGSERVFREIGATILNPIRGFNRLIRGEMNDVSQNPAEWRPSFVQAALDVGYRRIGDKSAFEFGDDVSSDGGFVAFRLWHGDLLTEITNKPFAHFLVTGELGSKKAQNESRRLSRLTAIGTLGGWAIKKDGDATTQALAGFLKYEYWSNPAVEWGGQSVRGGWVARFGDPRGFSIQTRLLGSFYPISAIRSDYFATEEGRDYDYGTSLGGHGFVSAVWWPRVFFTFGYDVVHQWTIDGEKSQHTIGGGSTELRVMLTRQLSLGALYQNFHRWSRYRTQPDVDQNSPMFYLYAGLAIPSLHSN